MRKIRISVLLILCSCIIANAAFADESSGDEKIKDTKKRIEEAINESEDDSDAAASVEEDDDQQSLADLLFELIFKIWAGYSLSIRYAAYPYANPLYAYNISSLYLPEEHRIVSLELSADATWHLDNTYGEINKLCLRLSALNINLFNQFIFTRSEGFSALSANAGISFFFPNFMLDLFAGVFNLDFLDRVFASFGAKIQLFFSGHIYVEFYNLNSIYKGFTFTHAAGCLSYALGRWGIGIGFNYSNYAGFEYLGPFVKISLWL
jgi:hypothetical protein